MQTIQPHDAVSFIGMGVMGAAMAANILKAGFRLTISSRSRDKAALLESEGARWVDTPAEAARGAACVALCVPDTPDVEAVLFGPNGIAEGVGQNAVVIDFSTISAGATAGFAARLLAERGAHLLDSPVSGGPQGAIDGTLTCMVGGDAEAFARAENIFRAVGKTITHLGPSGSGQVCKAANQLIITSTMQAVFEALAMGRKAGLDPMKMREALLGGSARSAVLENHAKRLLDGKFTPGFRAELMRKDMRLAVAAMRDFGVPAPVTAAAAQQMEATCNTGRATMDVVALGLLVNELAGVE
jgi:2-hydroxy-3-oxopropionate reductase